MKRLLTGFFILVFLFSCGNRKTKMDPFATITEWWIRPGMKPIRCNRRK